MTLYFLLGFILFLLSQAANGNAEDLLGGNNLVCYAELWAGGRSPPANYDLATLPALDCNYLILLFLTLDPNTLTLRMNTGYGGVDTEDFRKAVQLKEKNPWLNVLVAVSGFAEEVGKYSKMMAERQSRKTFVDSVVQVLKEYELDGLELHWIYPGATWRGGKPADKENFLQLVKELKVAFKPEGFILTAGVPSDEATLRAGYDVPELNRLLHQMHIRTLDMRGDWLGYASGHSPIYSSPWEKQEERHLNVNDSLSLWLREGANPRKLLLTIPFYGRSFTLKDNKITEPGSPTSGAGPQTSPLRAEGIRGYFEICDGLRREELEFGVQSYAETPYAFSEKDGLWVGYEDELSLKKKVKLLTRRKLAGAAVFAVGLDDFMGACGVKHFLLHKVRSLLDYYTRPLTPKRRMR